jgi:hypothetical protein
MKISIKTIIYRSLSLPVLIAGSVAIASTSAPEPVFAIPDSIDL